MSKCISCEHSEIEPTGEGLCYYYGVIIDANSESVGDCFKRITDDCNDEFLDDLINVY